MQHLSHKYIITKHEQVTLQYITYTCTHVGVHAVVQAMHGVHVCKCVYTCSVHAVHVVHIR